MKKRLEKKADLLLYKHGFNEQGKKIGKKKATYLVRTNESKKTKEKRLQGKIIKNNRDLISLRKSSDLSNMEMEIATFLSREQVFFHREYFMKGLYNPETRKPLFFDFYLPKYNLVIEFDGIQHFRNPDKHQLKNQKTKDWLKDLFCKRRKIHILRIPYWKKNRFEFLILERIDQITS